MAQSRAENLPVEKLRRCPIQFRPVCKETLEYVVLRNSIRDRGVLTSLLVRPVGDIYEVVDGSNRFEAILDLRLEIVPCNVKEMSDAEVIELQVEAHGGIPTKRVEYARALWKIINIDQDRSLQEVAYGIHRTIDWVKDTLSLICLSPSCQELVDDGKLPLNCAYEFAKLPGSIQDSLLDLLGSMPNRELRNIAQSQARHFNQGKKDARIEKAMIDKANLRGYIRNMREVERELEEPTVAAAIISEMNAETKLEVWCACLMWVLRRDQASLAYLRHKLFLESGDPNE